jgi:pimeloyl-ACP methyl ester carboxylesterase
MIEKAKKGFFVNIVERLLEKLIYQKTVRKEVEQMFLRNETSFINEQKAMLLRDSLLNILYKISHPTLAIFGGKDNDCYKPVEQIKKIPNAKIAIIENCGHMLSLEKPDATTSLMRYWLEYF